MSAATMSGSDAVKATSAASKQQLKSSNSGKALDGARKQTGSPVDGQNRKQQPPQPRAWQGPNPITQRASASTPNGTEKAVPKPQSQAQQKNTAESNADKHAHDRALYLIASFTGHDATLTMKNGEQFTGIFSGGSFDSSKQQYTLKMVRRTRSPTQQQVNGNVDNLMSNEYIGEGEDHVMMFDKEDTAELYVPDVVPYTAHPVQNGSINSSFRTDTEISARDSSMPRERELQRWDAGADSSIGMALEDSGEAGWDQFAANEKMYGVSSTYDENIYTTQINRTDPRFRQREAEAARIAREIEGTAPANAHVAEERRRDADRGEGLDEEEKYSGVQRDTTNLPRRAAGAYIPPSQRPITKTPTVPGAPYDPAIISSQLARPAPSTRTDKGKEPARTPELPTGLRTPENSQAGNHVAIAASATQPQRSNESKAEDHVRNVTDSFKQFANNEKLKIRQAQEAKRLTSRAEKNVKLNDLKKFASNFKLTSRVPDDLVPILAKDREKQADIQRKAEAAAKESEEKIKHREMQRSIEASPALSTTASHAGVGTPISHTQPAPSKQRMSQNIRAAPHSGPLQSPRQMAGLQQNRAYGRPGFPPPPQPLPADLRIPTGPAVPASEVGPLSPASSTKFNPGAKAFEFRPAASAFTPTTGASPSRERSTGKSDAAMTESADFFKDGKPMNSKNSKNVDDVHNPFKHMLATEYTDEQKKAFAANSSIPFPYRTPPTWPCEQEYMNTSYKDSIPKPPEPTHTHSQMHTPSTSSGQIPHAHQLPPHMQGQQAPTPSGRPPFIPPPHHGHPQGYAPGMPHFGPNGSVQNSPRFQHQQMAFNGQMPGVPMQQFAGGQMQGYGMSPSMGYRQMTMPPSGPMMMMPGHPQGQMQVPQNYPRGPQGYNPQMMPGMPGMPNGPSGNNFMGGPMPGQQQSYSPMPPHATPQMHQTHPYASSPRPGHMMQHTQSHQGYQPNPMHMGMGGPGMAPGPPFAQNPGAPHPYHMQQRQMSQGAYPQMTPRQGQVMPVGMQQPSPGQMGVGSHGDEGK